MDAIAVARQHCSRFNRSVRRTPHFDCQWCIALDPKTECPLQTVMTDGLICWDDDVFRPLEPDDDPRFQILQQDFWITDATFIIVRNIDDREITYLVVSRTASAAALLNALAA